MPGLSNSVRVSKDGQYVLATGVYKPRIKCFDVNNLSLKFERCFDSEAVTFEILSDDYSKVYLSFYFMIFAKLFYFRLCFCNATGILNFMRLTDVTTDWGYRNLAATWNIIIPVAICMWVACRLRFTGLIWNGDSFWRLIWVVLRP